MEKGDPCPFGVCLEGEGRNIAISSILVELARLEKSFSVLAGRVRALQFIVVGGFVIDFLVKSQAVQSAVSLFGR